MAAERVYERVDRQVGVISAILSRIYLGIGYCLCRAGRGQERKRWCGEVDKGIRIRHPIFYHVLNTRAQVQSDPLATRLYRIGRHPTTSRNLLSPPSHIAQAL
jgi:hypothetical protein